MRRMKEHLNAVAMAVVAAAVALGVSQAPQAALAKTFSDVPRGAWYYESVQYVSDNGIFHGYPDGTFRPSETLVREEAAAVFYNLLGKGEIAPTCPQTDVDQAAWYHNAVNWAVDSGVMHGYSSRTFGVGRSLTREELTCVVANAAHADLDKQSTASVDAKPDGNTVSSWARKAVAWALDNGVINGVPAVDGSRRIVPKGIVDRATMAAIMMNADKAGLFSSYDPAVRPDSKPNTTTIELRNSWATLYDDGELVFDKTDEVDVGRTVLWHGHGNRVNDSLLCRLRTVKITSRCGIELDDGDNHIDFSHFVSLSDISGLSRWDVSKVTNFDSMFEGCVSLDDLSPLANWSISNGVSLDNTFEHTSATIFPHWFTR